MDNISAIKKCERCQGAFECHPENITQCQCYGIAFTEQQKQINTKLYNDCLCRLCLIELSKTE